MHGYRFMLMSEEPARGALRKVGWRLIVRVLSYARPHIFLSVLLLLPILAGTGLGLLSPPIFRELIDRAIPQRDVLKLDLLAAALLAIPVLTGALGAVEYQRIALARVILKDPRILVLDEATSPAVQRGMHAQLLALRRDVRSALRITVPRCSVRRICGWRQGR